MISGYIVFAVLHASVSGVRCVGTYLYIIACSGVALHGEEINYGSSGN